MIKETRLDFQKWLLEKYGKELCKQIYDDVRDVSHEFYREVFADFDWEAYEAEKAKASK